MKIGPKTMDCVFIRYATNSKACQFLVHKSKHLDVHNNTIMESDNSEFFEHLYPFKTKLDSLVGGSKHPWE